jgi:DNA-binding MarR family transcriptional regulator
LYDEYLPKDPLLMYIMSNNNVSILNIFLFVKETSMSHPRIPSTNATPAAGEVLEALIRTTHYLHRQFEIRLSALDVPDYLTGPRLRFLIAVSESSPIRMNEMAAKLGIQARTVTQFVDALEQEKLLVRLPDPDDRRATFLQLTDSAPPLIQQARSAMSAASEEVLGTLTDEMRDQLFQLLQRLSSKLPADAD